MAITRVRVKLNSEWHNLTYNTATGKYEVNLTAPSITSFNVPGGKYPVEFELLDHEGYTKTEKRNLKVVEKIPPTINITGPTAVFDGKRPAITFDVGDEVNGSGINLDTLLFTLDDIAFKYNALGMTYNKVADRYYFTYLPPETLADGRRTITVDVADNDGNKAIPKQYSFEIFGVWIDVISDRTEADVEFLKALHGRELTPEEWEAYGKENYKGALNVSDLNRIEYDAVFVYKKMKYYGYGAKEILAKLDWIMPDLPEENERNRLLENIRYLKDNFIDVGAVLPFSLDMPFHTDINDIERTLELLRLGIEHLEKQWVYSGEVVSGGGILL